MTVLISRVPTRREDITTADRDITTKAATTTTASRVDITVTTIIRAAISHASTSSHSR